VLSSVDRKIDGAALDAITGHGEYEATGAKLEGDAWICGRTTMRQHLADSASNTPAGPQPVFTPRRADSYAIGVDTLGKLQWSSCDLDGDHLVCVLSERAPADYLTMLREKGISYVVAGESSVNLAETVDQLGEHFGIRAAGSDVDNCRFAPCCWKAAARSTGLSFKSILLMRSAS
jgi:2,5-diamino-6-(ribosylamino)-4(3H)-pyrimidinone 5'-phosphate reductase